MLKSSKPYLLFIIFGTLLALFSLVSILLFTDPSYSSWITLIFFYFSLMLSVLGIFTLIGLGLRTWLSEKVYLFKLSASFRQALFIALLITISLFLQANHLLFWWVELSLILFLLFVEFFLSF